jgi:hypothetical protein
MLQGMLAAFTSMIRSSRLPAGQRESPNRIAAVGHDQRNDVEALSGCGEGGDVAALDLIGGG